MSNVTLHPVGAPVSGARYRIVCDCCHSMVFAGQAPSRFKQWVMRTFLGWRVEEVK